MLNTIVVLHLSVVTFKYAVPFHNLWLFFVYAFKHFRTSRRKRRGLGGRYSKWSFEKNVVINRAKMCKNVLGFVAK